MVHHLRPPKEIHPLLSAETVGRGRGSRTNPRTDRVLEEIV